MMADGQRFTPRMPDGQRAEMLLNAEDGAKMKRGRPWHAVVTDQLTGKRWEVAGAARGLPGCFCDAVVIVDGKRDKPKRPQWRKWAAQMKKMADGAVH